VRKRDENNHYCENEEPHPRPAAGGPARSIGKVGQITFASITTYLATKYRTNLEPPLLVFPGHRDNHTLYFNHNTFFFVCVCVFVVFSAGGAAGHAKFKCPVVGCGLQAPSIKSMQAHFESKHPKLPFDPDACVDMQAIHGGSTQGVAVQGSKKK